MNEIYRRAQLESLQSASGLANPDTESRGIKGQVTRKFLRKARQGRRIAANIIAQGGHHSGKGGTFTNKANAAAHENFMKAVAANKTRKAKKQYTRKSMSDYMDYDSAVKTRRGKRHNPNVKD